MKLLKSLLCFAMLCTATACTSNEELVEKALAAGNLKEAELLLKDVDDSSKRRYYGGILIDEYLSIDNLDRAIYVFERITGHCSMYQMQYKYSYSSADYTETYSQKLYKALMNAGRYDEAWSYHARSYDSEDYPGNAPDYFAYMTDAIIHMCNMGQSAQAARFIKQKGIWFLKNVDNHEWGHDYPNYRYDIMRGELNRVFNDAQN